MEGFVNNYYINHHGILIILKHNDKSEYKNIPFHAIVDVEYTEGDAVVRINDIYGNSKAIRFKNKQVAKEFFKELNKGLFEIEF